MGAVGAVASNAMRVLVLRAMLECMHAATSRRPARSECIPRSAAGGARHARPARPHAERETVWLCRAPIYGLTHDGRARVAVLSVPCAPCETERAE